MKKFTFTLLVLASAFQYLSAQTVDSVIHRLSGCWKWDHYFGGFPGLPPTPPDSNVYVEFFQDAIDSAQHSVSARTYDEAVLKFSGRCNVADSLADYYLLSCPLFDSFYIAGSPPVYFNFEDDTLLFPQQEFVDGFVFAFLKKCGDTTHTQVLDLHENPVHIFPNPASEQLVLDLKDAVLLRFQLYNTMGQQLADVRLKQTARAAFNFSAYPEGAYFVHIETTQGVLAKKVIVVR